MGFYRHLLKTRLTNTLCSEQKERSIVLRSGSTSKNSTLREKSQTHRKAKTKRGFIITSARELRELGMITNANRNETLWMTEFFKLIVMSVSHSKIHWNSCIACSRQTVWCGNFWRKHVDISKTLLGIVFCFFEVGSHHIALVGFQPKHPPASAYWGLGSKGCATTMPSFFPFGIFLASTLPAVRDIGGTSCSSSWVPVNMLKCLYLPVGFLRQSLTLAQAGLELGVCLPQPPECWVYRPAL